MIIICFSYIILICTYSLRVFEYYIIVNKSANFKGYSIQDNDSISRFANSLWVIYDTMTTVGYGDYYIFSHLGRMIGVISCISGLFMVSLMIVFMKQFAELTHEEKKAYLFIKKITAVNNANDKAKNVIYELLKLRLCFFKKAKLKYRFVNIARLKHCVNLFKNKSKLASLDIIPVDETFKILEHKINNDIDKIKRNFQKLSNCNNILNSISNEQKEQRKLLNKIKNREENLGRYLTDLNNEILKSSIKIFSKKRKKKRKKVLVNEDKSD